MTQPAILCTVKPAGTGDINAPLIVLGPSLGTTADLWAAVVSSLAATHRVLRFDLPGHGFSPPATEPFTLEELADAVVGLVDSVGVTAFHYAGISLGGAVGLAIAARHPGRLASLAVFCSGSKIGTASAWTDRAAGVRASGTPSLVAGSAARWFAPDFLGRDPRAGSHALDQLLDIDDESYALACEALAVFDQTDALGGIRTPVLCISGEHDTVTPPAQLQELAARIPGARAVQLAGVAHLPALEQPIEVGALLGEWIAGAGAARSAASAHDAGMLVRRAVLGDAHVDRANASITPETADFQDFITRYAWGEIWTRPGLDRRTRSFLTIAALVTGGHEGELAMHVRAALTNGLSRAEISEAILHTAIYAGVPAANAAFVVARETFAGLDAATTPSETP
ncbi:4-carboxymuconolactone decarboxylase [Cryobacterium melibiosiphilum]|uniref:4-carboxymuconolactone decarboxylase n=1 Tax=Cryobacterium melibiosiphilum TaxID=995039 RepID=A0A3A5M870_9MICO|nr:4-carboxymuconolactone decarboxylase [Cryobacterium melibiosiphilum]RJT85160.1 4-carboxymuconolactone decarboxylase [Cryobacterium melibiosiphilum]